MASLSAIPFNDLGRATRDLRGDLSAALERVLDSGWFVLGTEVAAFEREFQALIGTEHAVGVASGTDAIELALRALGLEPGDEVVTQANTCVPTVSGIERAGLTPVLCDVEPEGGTMDPDSLRGAIGPRTRAVVPVHLYGQCADLDAISAVASEAGVEVVEDCAQAHGAELRGRRAGTIGRLGCFSFYPTKNLGGFGDGGAIVTNDSALADQLRSIRQYGQSDRYVHTIRGVNSRLDELQAAVLRVKLPHVDGWNDRRAEIAAVYTDALAHAPARPLSVLEGRRHVFHLFVVEAEDRGALQTHLGERGIQTLIHYPHPVHRQGPYRALAQGPVRLSVAERLCEHVLSIPLYPELTDSEVESVAAALTAFEV